MNNPRISMIAALAERDRAIGFKNSLLWHIPKDLQHFKELTAGHAIIMGEKTYWSIGGKPLPKRTNIILSDNPDFHEADTVRASSLDEALTKARAVETEEVFICGGASVYAQYLPKADRLYLTLVEGQYEADTYFPDYREFGKVISEEKAEDGQYQFTFVTLEKN